MFASCTCDQLCLLRKGVMQEDGVWTGGERKEGNIYSFLEPKS